MTLKRRVLGTKKSQAVMKEVEEWVRADIVRPVKYPTWISNPVLVKKVDDTWRMCIDFKNLNSACPKDYYPLPEIDLKIEAVMGFPFKCFLDAYKGYNQIQMSEDDEEKTTFYTDQGTYCYMKMPFGLKNAGATLCRYFEAHPIRVTTDQPIKQILNKPEVSGKLAKYAVELGAYNIMYVPRNAIKGQVLADFINEILEINMIIEEEEDNWMTPIIKCLEEGVWPTDENEWGLDILRPLLKGPDKLKFIIIVIDYFTKWMEAKPLAKPTGKKIKPELVKKVDVKMVLEKKPQSKKQTAKEGKTAIGKGGMRRENVTEEAKQAPTSPEIVVLDKHKRPMMPSSALLSSFYERNVVLNKFLYEEVKKVIEWIWSTSKKEGLYPGVEVASGIVDVWSVILNHEEQFRYMLLADDDKLQFKKLVNVSRAKKLEKSHDPLALDDVHTNSEDPLTFAMLLLARAITQKFSTPTNNRLCTSSNTRNQAIIQGDTMNIQNRNSGLFEPRLQETLQLFNATTAVEKNIMLGIVQSQEFQEHREYFMEQMMEEIKELILTYANGKKIHQLITLLCWANYESAYNKLGSQSSSNTENKEQMYPTHTKIINSTIGDDQIDSDIIFVTTVV
ncbi:reverse transcriptase domain-containing protein [Tanacetum coccineum]